jgi:hypothetical protein
MTHAHANIKPQDNAIPLVDHQPTVASRLHLLPDEPPRIGSFATGMASDEPRPWSGKQMVGARQSGVAGGALPDEPPRIGSFATGMASDEPRPWTGKQMVADRLREKA